MSTRIGYTPEQEEAQGRTIARVFRLPDYRNVTSNWSLEGEGGHGKTMLRIELVEWVDAETVNALVNGIDLPGADSPPIVHQFDGDAPKPPVGVVGTYDEEKPSGRRQP